MTISNITIYFIKGKTKQIYAQEIIESLKQYGWSLNDQGKVSYLPLGDQDLYDWQIQSNISYTELADIIKNKEEKGEIIGIIMTWQNTSIGGTILISKEGYISINLDINRKKINLNHCEITDFQWYLEKLLPPLQHSFGIESFMFEEIR